MAATQGSGGFVHLRVRSAYSLLEGAIKAEAIGPLTKAAGMPAVAIADRANLFGALEFSVTVKDCGVQPIIGCALPVTGIGEAPGSRLNGGRRGRTPTVTLLAQDETGYRNLSVLSSTAYLESAADAEPAVPWAQVAAHAEGLILLSGGPDGPVDPLFAAGKRAEGRAALAAMQEAFGDRFYVELQRHGTAAEAAAEPELVACAYDRDLPLVATNDVYFAEPKMAPAHDALLCVAEGAFIGQEDRRRVTPEHSFKSAEQMRALFADLPEACDHTLEIARRCAFMVKKRDPILPRFTTDAARSEPEELAHQAREGLKARLAALREAEAAGGPGLAGPEADYAARLEREIGVISGMGFSGYFLIVADFIKWAKAQGIPVGPGRGSGAGSLVAWVLTITDLDPLRFGLLFERFLNPERVSMPDFDIDFCQERREEVIAYVQRRYGVDRVAQIITFGTLQARAALRDVGRVLQLPLGQVDRLAKLVPANPANPVTLAKAMDIEPRLKAEAERDPAVARMLDVALQLEGLYRNASTHAAGVVIGDRPLTELTPLYRDPRSELPATQFNMKWVESAGLVKFDFLGLKTLTVLDRARGFMRQAGDGTDLDRLPLDDKPSYELLASGQTIGVFQLESQGMRDTLRKMRCQSVEEITALISLYRPGPMENIDVYVDGKMGRRPVDTLHPSLTEVLSETYGVIVYQEQVMQIAQILAGYSLGEADLLRRAMGKKKKEEMDQQRARFVSGAAERGVPQAQSGAIFDLVAKFAGYGFNKSHAAAYAMIAYQTAWLKANQPTAFFAASMSLDLSNTDKLAVFHQDARRFGVEVRRPDVNRSAADFAVTVCEDGSRGAVLYALGAIRNVGLQAMQHLVAEREARGPFTDVFDLVERCDPKLVNKRALENLIRAGALDDLPRGERDRAALLANLDLLIAHSQSAAAERASSQASLFGASLFGGAGEAASAVRPRLQSVKPWTAAERLDQELAAVGFYLSGHPLQDVMPGLQRKRVQLHAEAVQLAVQGHEVMRMAGVVRRRQERASAQSGERFAFVTLSDPTGEYEVLFPPESLRRCRDVLEVGACVLLKVRAKAKDGEVRLFGDEAETLDRAAAEAVSGLRVHLHSAAADLKAELASVRARLDRARDPKGGELVLLSEIDDPRGVDGRLRVEVKLKDRYRIDGALMGALKTAPGVTLLEEA